VTVWEILKIEPTDDERAIKRAYAKELKRIRPGEDPIGFQKLREARDQAIWLGAYDDYEDEFDDESDDGVGFDEDALSGSNINHNETEPRATVLQELDKPVDDQVDAPVGEQAVTEPANGDFDRIVIDEDRVLDPKEEGHELMEIVYDPDFSYEKIREKIEMLLGPWGGWKLGQWQSFINDLRESPFETSQYAESEILQTISEALLRPSPTNCNEQAEKLQVLIYLNQEFGWTQNDRRVYAELPDEEAANLLEIIRSTQKDSALLNKKTYYDASYFPLLVEDDFLSYLGKNDTVYERYYNDCKNAGRQFRPSWSWPAFLGSPLWLAWRCNDGLEALYGIFYVIALFFIGTGFKHLGDADFSNDISFYIGIFMIFGLHTLTGVYGKRMVLNTMATVLTEVEEDMTLSESDKQKKIAGVGQGGYRSIFDFFFGMLGIALIVGVIFMYFSSK